MHTHTLMHTYTIATSLWQPDSDQNSVASGNLSLLGQLWRAIHGDSLS